MRQAIASKLSKCARILFGAAQRLNAIAALCDAGRQRRHEHGISAPSFVTVEDDLVALHWRHLLFASDTSSTKRSKMYMLSSGPGDASEWYWIVISGASLCRRPSTVPSFRCT